MGKKKNLRDILKNINTQESKILMGKMKEQNMTRKFTSKVMKNRINKENSMLRSKKREIQFFNDKF